MSSATSASDAIDFVSDVICPWCFIGFRRLEAALAQTGGGIEQLTFRPFLLDPTTPPEGADLRERLAQKYGVDPEAMFGRVEAAARESGIPLDFAKVRRTPNTVRAHALLGKAREKGTQAAVARALFEGYFLEGKDIGDLDVLVGIATAHGFTGEEARGFLQDDDELDAVRAEAADLSKQGIRGVPFAIFGGKLAVSGAQPTEIFAQAIARSREAQA